jgi:hypothetical protein
VLDREILGEMLTVPEERDPPLLGVERLSVQAGIDGLDRLHPSQGAEEPPERRVEPIAEGARKSTRLLSELPGVRLPPPTP